MDETIISAISSFGFPAIACFYLMFRVNKTLENLTVAINTLSRDVERREVETQNRIERLECSVRELQQRN